MVRTCIKSQCLLYAGFSIFIYGALGDSKLAEEKLDSMFFHVSDQPCTYDYPSVLRPAIKGPWDPLLSRAQGKFGRLF